MLAATGLEELTNTKQEKMPRKKKEGGDEDYVAGEDDSYEDEDEKEEEEDVWTEAQVETIGVDRLLK